MLVGDHCRVTEPAIQNVVVQFRVRGSAKNKFKLVESHWQKSVGSRNFYVTRCPPVSFTVFAESGHVIATGIRHLGLVSEVPETFAGHESLCTKTLDLWEGPRVVNSTYAGRIHPITPPEELAKTGGWCTSVVLARFSDDLEGLKGARVSFRSQSFPSIVLRWEKGDGCINVFNNGNYVLVGVRTEGQARLLSEKLCAIMNKYWKMSGLETGCAWIAGWC